jgi:UDP-GlcNAc:undecaprenyl-phosphate GlcNAc-1-phosphate transferase
MLALLGFLDDMRGVSPVVRFSYEATCGLALWLAGVRAGVFGEAWADLLVTIVWVVAVTNAVNLIDNMDGLAAGVTAASALGIFAIAARNGDFLVGSLALAVAGASLGFLRHNFPPARIFLGDAGSLLLGLLLAALTLMLDLPVGPALPRMLTAGLLLAVPLFDLAVVVAARTAGRRAMWRGGTDHTSHRLAAAGLSGRAVALVFAGTQAVCSVLAFAVYDEPSGVVAAASVVAAIAGVALLGVVVRMPTPAA